MLYQRNSQAINVAFSFTLLCVVCIQSAAGQTALTPVTLFKRVSPSVFVIEALNSQGEVVFTGSGVAISKNVIVTSKRVAESATKQGSDRRPSSNRVVERRIRKADKTWQVSKIFIDPHHDLATIEVVGLSATPISLRPSSFLSVGEQVYAVGSPQGLEMTLLTGFISGLRKVEQANLIETSISVAPGSNGGGLFDAQGQLIGITTDASEANVSFALPSDWIKLSRLLFSGMPESGTLTDKHKSLWSDAITAELNIQTFLSVAVAHGCSYDSVGSSSSDGELLRPVDGELLCIFKANSPECFHNWPEWRKALAYMIELRHEIKRGESVMADSSSREELIAAGNVNLGAQHARRVWSDLVDVYCQELPGETYVDLDGKTRGCPSVAPKER